MVSTEGCDETRVTSNLLTKAEEVNKLAQRYIRRTKDDKRSTIKEGNQNLHSGFQEKICELFVFIC